MEVVDMVSNSKAIGFVSGMSTSSANDSIRKVNNMLKDLKEDIEVSTAFQGVVFEIFDFTSGFVFDILNYSNLSSMSSELDSVEDKLNNLITEIYNNSDSIEKSLAKDKKPF